MNVFQAYKNLVEEAVSNLATAGVVPQGLDTSRISVEPPRESAHGDMATNAAMVLAKPAGVKPRELAEQLTTEIRRMDSIKDVAVAGPGFINWRVKPSVWHDCLLEILRQGPAYGDSTIGTGQRVNVEYVSANPTGPLHVGHARGAVVGDVLATLLQKAGFDVLREYYVNDAGAQVDTLARSAFLRYREARGESIGDIPDGLYPGAYLKPVGERLSAEFGDSLLEEAEEVWLPIVRTIAVNAMMDLIRDDLAALGIHHDVFTSERSLVEAGKVDDVLVNLEKQSLLYTGVLEPPKGKTPEDWEPRPQLLFRSTEFGDDVDRPIKKSDGSWTYFASDISYHLDKYERGFPTLIDVLGADHGGYVKRMKAATKAISQSNAELDVKICQMVKLLESGEQVKMSKRSGTFVTLRELIDSVGKDVVRFFLLTRKNDAPMDFDLTAVQEQSRDNPVFYVQYAHARSHSVMRMAREAIPDIALDRDKLVDADLRLLTTQAELALIKRMAGWPRTVEGAAESHEPHRIAFYMYDLASEFHALWTKGKEEPDLRFIVADNRSLTEARLALVLGVQAIVASGLRVFGVEPVEEMR